jgi:NAD(P)-dependent dehydrogenase (short-subunit alcohol dehydrogenase family)
MYRPGLKAGVEMAKRKTVLVTGASQGIGAAIAQAFLDRGYSVVATARNMTKAGFAPSAHLALVDGDIGRAATAEKVTQTAMARFGSIDHVVNCAGIFSVKPFTDYTADEFHRFVSTNLEGFIFITQLAVKQILLQGTGGSVTTITAALADNPVVGSPASIPMMTKGGLNAVTLSLASEYAKNNIRFNAVAPGIVDTPLHEGAAKLASFGLECLSQPPETSSTSQKSRTLCRICFVMSLASRRRRLDW